MASRSKFGYVRHLKTPPRFLQREPISLGNAAVALVLAIIAALLLFVIVLAFLGFKTR